MDSNKGMVAGGGNVLPRRGGNSIREWQFPVAKKGSPSRTSARTTALSASKTEGEFQNGNADGPAEKRPKKSLLPPPVVRVKFDVAEGSGRGRAPTLQGESFERT